jgi:hypothetical protein
MAIKGKKGVFFTFMAILMVSILVVMFSSDENFTSKNRVPVISARVKTADNFVKNLEGAYIKTSFYTSSYNALKSLLLYMDDQDKFLESEQDLNNKFTEILLNGSIDEKRITEYGINLMEGNTFNYRLDNIESASENYFHLETQFKKNDTRVVIFQTNETGSWQVGINLTMNYSVDADVAKWNKTKTFTTFLDLTKFDDPLYLINAEDSQKHQKIKPTIFNSTQWNITTLRIHVNNETYRYDENATSYLSRMFNSTSKSKCCGIESFINQTLCNNVEDKSYVDFCFWSNACNTANSGYGGSLYNITGISNASYPLKLDAYHIGQYNVTDYAVFP